MRRIIRSILSGFCFFIFGIGSLIVGFILFPVLILIFRKKSRLVLVNVVRAIWKFFVWIMCVTRLIKIKISCEDTQKLEDVRGCVVIANHPSLIDIVILVSLVPKAVCVVKGSLARNFWMGIIVRMVYIVNDEDVIKFLNDTAELLKSGFNVIIFPEGTRTKTGDFEHKLHRGFAQIALHTGADILPVVIACKPPVLGKSQPWWNVGERTSIFCLSVKEKICCERFMNFENFHEKAKILTDFVRKILFF